MSNGSGSNGSGGASDHTRAHGAPRRRSARRLAPGAAAFVLLVAVLGCWALALPRGAGPDEPSHARKAAAVVRGQLLGPPIPGYPDGVRQVVVPGELSGRFYPCYAFAPDTTADCQPAVAPGGALAQGTTAGKYPPLGYVAAGFAGFAARGYRRWYALRFGQVVLVAALLAWAVQVLCRPGRPRLARAGLLLALTPTAAFLGGVVNPNGVEAAAATLAWAAGAALAFGDRDGDGASESTPALRSDVVAFAVAAVTMTLTRTLSPVWLTIIVATLAIVAGRARCRVLAARRSVRWAGAALVGAAAVQAGWIGWSGLAYAVDRRVAVHYPVGELVRVLATRPWLLYRQMVGQFGWYEVNAPAVTIGAWTVATVLLAGGGLLAARRRAVLAMAGVVAATLAVPAVVDAVEASRAGLVWQGRYSLPLAGGLTIVAGFELARRRPPEWLAGRLAGVVAAAFAVAHVSGFVWALHRYAVGVRGTVRFWREAPWLPPVPVVGLLVVQPVVVVALAWFVACRPPTTFAALTAPAIALPVGDVPAAPAQRPSPWPEPALEAR